MVFGLFDQAYIHPAECIIKVAGEPIRELYPFVTEVKVNATRTRFTEATVTLFSPVDETGHWLVAEHLPFDTWADITIEADFQDATEQVFRGVILDFEPSFPTAAGEATVQLVCRDDSARLAREARPRSWGKLPVGTTDAVILRTLAGEAGLSVDPASGPGQSNLVLRQNTDDIAFLRSRAIANGYELMFRDGQIYFGPRRLTLKSQPTIMVYAGQVTNCRSFTPSNRGQQRSAFAYARRDKNGDPSTPVTVKADLPLMGTKRAQGRGAGLPDHVGYLGCRTVPDDAQCETIARGHANDGDMSIRAAGELDGSLYGHVLRVGEPVEVDGVGELYSGTYYVDTVTHQFDTHGYNQSFELSRNALGRKAGGGVVNKIAALL